jgi:AraC-like DNA-binding protein
MFDDSQLTASNPPRYSRLGVTCPKEELLDTVQALLHDVLPVHRPTAITKSVRQPAVSDPTTAVASDRPTGGLAPGAQRRVRQYVENSFAQKIDLSRLAGIAGLSTSYFSRAFKQSFGMPPHRYVMIRRLAAGAVRYSSRDGTTSTVAPVRRRHHYEYVLR